MDNNNYSEFFLELIGEKTADIIFGGAEKVKDFVTNAYPESKVLFISSSENFNELKDQLTKEGIKVFTAVVTEKTISVKNLSSLFSFPSDIRAVICFDNSLIPFSEYYATVNNVQCIEILGGDLSNVYNPFIMIEGQEFSFNCKRQLFIDLDKIDVHADELYAYNVSRLVCLADYRIFGAFYKKELNKRAYGIVKRAITDTFANGNKEKEKLLYVNTLAVKYANYLTGGEMNRICAVDRYYEIIEKLNGVSDKKDICSLTEKILNVYALCFEKINVVSEYIPDYNYRTETVYGRDKAGDKLKQNLIAESQTYFSRIGNLTDYIKKLGEEMRKTAAVFSKIKEKYYELTNDHRVADARIIRLSGDLEYGFNGMSLLREQGFLE